MNSAEQTAITATETQGSWKETDKNGTPITLEWYKGASLSDVNQDLKGQIITAYAEAFADNERDLLLDEKFNIKSEYAEQLTTMLNCLPDDKKQETIALLKSVKERASEPDRKVRVELKKQRFMQQPFENFGKNSLGVFIVVAKSESKEILGCVVFAQQKDNSAELDPLCVVPTAQKRGIAEKLVFSILNKNLLPDTKRIYLDTQLWNTRAQHVYKDKLGFKECGRHGYFVDFEYIVTTNNNK